VYILIKHKLQFNDYELHIYHLFVILCIQNALLRPQYARQDALRELRRAAYIVNKSRHCDVHFKLVQVINIQKTMRYSTYRV